MKAKYLLIAICASFMLVSCAKQRPQWIDGSSTKYPEPRYFIGVGAVSMDKGGGNQQLTWAGDRARAEVAKTLRSKIESTTTAYRRVTTEGTTRPTTTSEQTDVVTATTNEVMEGVEIKSYHRDKSSRMLYALAVLDRTKAARKLKNQVDDMKRSMLTEMEEGGGYQEQNETLLAIRHYNRALHMAEEINSKNELISVLDPVIFVQSDVKNHVAELNKILYGLKKNIRFTISVTGPASRVRTYIIRGLSHAGFLTSGKEATAKKTYVLEGDTDLTRRGDLKWDKNFIVQIYQADLDLEVKNPESNETLGALTWSVSANEKTSEMASKSAVRALGRTVEKDIANKLLDLF